MRVVEDLADLLARYIGDIAVLIAEQIDTVGRKLVKRQEGRWLTVDLEGEGVVALAPVGSITRIGNLILDLVDAADKAVSSQQEEILLALGTRGALNGKISLALRRPFTLVILGKHDLIQRIDGRYRGSARNSQLILLTISSRHAAKRTEIIHIVFRLTHSESFQNGLPSP